MYEFLKSTKTIAVVGISDNETRSSYGVAEYLTRYYEVIPVNPLLSEWKGRPCYPSLSAVPKKIDLIDVFRRSEHVPDLVDEAIKLKILAIWLQLGVVHEDAAQRARAAGIHVVMDECLAVVDRQLRA